MISKKTAADRLITVVKEQNGIVLMQVTEGAVCYYVAKGNSLLFDSIGVGATEGQARRSLHQKRF